MKRRWLLFGSALLAFMLLAMPGVPALAGPRSLSALRSDAVVLTLNGADGTVHSLTMEQLQTDFAAFVGYAGCVKSGKVGMEAPHPVKGVLLTDLLKSVGYDSTTTVTLSASDGYSQALSPQAVLSQGVTVYQALPPDYPQVDMPADNPLTAIIAYQQKTVAGATVDDANPWEDLSTQATAGGEAEGPLRFWYAYPTYADPGYVTSASLSVRMVNGVMVARPVAAKWSVSVKGPKKTFQLSYTQFKNWAASTSYGETTVKVGGHKYSGLPLYIVVGRVDDGNSVAFNTRLARKGYKIQLRSSSRTVVLSSKCIARRSLKIILAWKKDGKELSGKSAPLWLVGSPLAGSQRIAGIKSITLRGVPK